MADIGVDKRKTKIYQLVSEQVRHEFQPKTTSMSCLSGQDNDRPVKNKEYISKLEGMKTKHVNIFKMQSKKQVTIMRARPRVKMRALKTV